MALGAILAVVLPMVALAQVPSQTISNCCELKHDIDPYAATNQICEPNADASACTNGGSCWAKGVELSTSGATPDVDWGGYCTMDTVYTVTDWIFWIFLAVVIIIGVATGFTFMTAGGDPGKVEKARGMIVYLVVGIIVAVIVKLIPALARSIVGI